MTGFRTASLLLLACLLLPGVVLADVQATGLLEGYAVDLAGDPISDLAVVLDGPRGRLGRTTDRDGGYRFAGLAPGKYTLSAEGGLESSASRVRVPPGGTVRLDLRVGLTAAGAVEVVAASMDPLLSQRFHADISSSLTADRSRELAFPARNFQSTTGIFAGASHDAKSLALGRQRPSIQGSEWQETAGYVDGVDTSNTRGGGGTRLFLPTSFLEEVRLHSAGYEARLGRSVGGILNAVVKSGSNEVEGTLLSVLQSQRWRAQSDAVPLPRDTEVTGSYELSLGGRWVRDRLWFFAATADNTSNEIDALADGTVLDNSLRQRSTILKITAQPRQSHSLVMTAIDAPVSKRFWSFQSADRFTPGDYDLNERFARLGWYSSPGPDLHLQVQAATYDSEIVRRAVELREIDPTASPASPRGNQSLYEDLDARLRYNALADASGPGFNRFPRSQASAEIDWYRGRHVLEGGIDFQDLGWRSFNDPIPIHRGNGYDETLPGGFVEPRSKQVFQPQEAPSETRARIASFHLQDRLTLGSRWTVRAGLRVDSQRHENDVGERAATSTDWAPRIGATYDVSGRGEVLVQATLGRYYQAIPLNLVGEVLARRPSGLNSWREFEWNPETGLYDRLLVEVPPPDPEAIQSFDPYHKDEVTLGVTWAPRSSWLASAHLTYWELGDLYWVTEQFDDEGVPFVSIRNWPQAERSYLGLQLAVDHRVDDLWWSANYTLSALRGNMFPTGSLDEETLFEGLGGVDPTTGRTDATSVNRYGPGTNDRPHNLNLTAVRRWRIGRQELSLSGLLSFRSGRPWTPIRSVALVDPDSRLSIHSWTYAKPRGSRRLPDTLQLNVAANWSPPLGDRLSARLGIEIANLTDEQELVVVNAVTRLPPAGRLAYEHPREVRLLLGLDF